MTTLHNITLREIVTYGQPISACHTMMIILTDTNAKMISLVSPYFYFTIKKISKANWPVLNCGYRMKEENAANSCPYSISDDKIKR